MSLISREAAIKLIMSGEVGYDSLVECPEECNSMLVWAADEVAKMPTIDAVEVVRCKDCTYWDGTCCADFCTTDPDGYCSWGERRKDGQEMQ